MRGRVGVGQVGGLVIVLWVDVMGGVVMRRVFGKFSLVVCRERIVVESGGRIWRRGFQGDLGREDIRCFWGEGEGKLEDGQSCGQDRRAEGRIRRGWVVVGGCLERLVNIGVIVLGLGRRVGRVLYYIQDVVVLVFIGIAGESLVRFFGDGNFRGFLFFFDVGFVYCDIFSIYFSNVVWGIRGFLVKVVFCWGLFEVQVRFVFFRWCVCLVLFLQGQREYFFLDFLRG